MSGNPRGDDAIEQVRDAGIDTEIGLQVFQKQLGFPFDQALNHGRGHSRAVIREHGLKTTLIVQPDVLRIVVPLIQSEAFLGQHLLERLQVKRFRVHQHAVKIEENRLEHSE